MERYGLREIEAECREHWKNLSVEESLGVEIPKEEDITSSSNYTQSRDKNIIISATNI